MTNKAARSLLPAGLRDILPPFAEHEAQIASKLMAGFARYGYERVKPPLIEFEESLFAGAGRAMAKDTFRVMDPLSQRMMGLRADMTVQAARIAATRLADAPRPLRLSYFGQALRVKGGQLRPERQFGQTGIELFGVDSAQADVEVISLAVKGALALGVEGLSIDLAIPTLADVLVGEMGEGSAALKDALAFRDLDAALSSKGKAADIVARLIDAAGPADKALKRLAALSLPPEAEALRNRLEQVTSMLKASVPEAAVTIDPVENRGFGYQTGVAFTLFARGRSGELGRGGRYFADGEAAVGATLFMDALMEAAPLPEPRKRVFAPMGSSIDGTDRLMADGWVVIHGLVPVMDGKEEAARQRCSHYLGRDGQIHPIEG